MAGSSWPALIAGSKARASDVEAKFDWLEGHLYPMLGGSTTTGTYDLGNTTAQWRDAYFSRRVLIGMNTSSAGFFWGHNAANVGLLFAGNVGFTTTAVSINAVNDSNTANIPLEIRSSLTRITAGGLALADTSTAVTEFSTDGTLAGNSDLAVPTEKAVKTYVDNLEFVGAAKGTNTSVLVSASTATALSITADTGLYLFQATAIVGFTTTVAPAAMGVTVQIHTQAHTLGSTLPPGFTYSCNGIFNTNTSFHAVSMSGFMSLTSGGHTIYLSGDVGSSAGMNTVTAFTLVVRRISA